MMRRRRAAVALWFISYSLHHFPNSDCVAAAASNKEDETVMLSNGATMTSSGSSRTLEELQEAHTAILQQRQARANRLQQSIQKAQTRLDHFQVPSRGRRQLHEQVEQLQEQWRRQQQEEQLGQEVTEEDLRRYFYHKDSQDQNHHDNLNQEMQPGEAQLTALGQEALVTQEQYQ